MNTRPWNVFGSMAFAGATATAIFATFRTSGLVMRVEDGTPVFFKDSSGSNAGQDEYLFFVVLWLPSALIRLCRALARPAFLEIVLFGLTSVFVYIGFSSIGTDTFRLTLDVTGDPWIAAWLAATGTAAVAFLLLCTGWLALQRARV